MENNGLVGNRKRPRPSPNAANLKTKDESILNIEPPNKRQKISSKRSSKSKSRRTKKQRNNAESKDEERDNDHFLNGIKPNTITINRISDPVRFEDDEDDDYEDKTRKLKFNIFTVNDNNIYIPLSDFFRAFKYSSTSVPKPKEIRKSFMEHIDNNLNETYGHDGTLKKDELITKYRGKLYVSEAGFCVLIRFLFATDNGKYLQHFTYHRFYYRKKLFCNKSLSVPRIKKPRSIEESSLCPASCLDFLESEFVDNPCDCEVRLPLNCPKLGLKAEDIPETNDNDWFCPFCTNYASLDDLKQRRKDQLEADWGYEVEKVVDYRYSDNYYLVKWKGYPNAANLWEELSSSFIEAVEQFWQKKKSPIPNKAQQAIDRIKSEPEQEQEVEEEKVAADADNDDNIAITKTMKDISLEIDNKNKNKNKKQENEAEDEEDDIEMKAVPEPTVDSNAAPEANSVFVPVKLNDIMNPEYIIRRQKYTKETFARRKDVTLKYKQKLQQEVIKGSALGQEIKYEMVGDKLPKYHLRCINENWDSGLPRIRDIIKTFLSRNWKEWDHDVSQKSFVIGEIIDPENPAKKYGTDQGVHEHKAYGLFAIEHIKKDTLLFEYAGCVKEIGDASKKLDHLETELDQTTLFDLIGHLDKKNRNKLHWGNKPNEQLVIDPSKWHNEGVYMNDFRTNVMTDPDDDIEVDSDDDIAEKEEEDDDDNQGRKQNVKFYEVLVNNWPRVFAVAVRDIEPNEELLGDYGCDFWANFRLMMKRQSQLNEIKTRINKEWEIKYQAAQKRIKELESEIKQLRK